MSDYPYRIKREKGDAAVHVWMSGRMKKRLEELAGENERSLSGEVRIAVRKHIREQRA